MEVLIGVLLLSTAVMVFIQMLQSSGNVLTLTGHSFAANHVASKVLFDLTEESRLNGTLIELMREYPEMKARDKIVEAQSFYFRNIRDSVEPWGSIFPAKEGGINKDSGELYREFEPFQITVFAQRPQSLSSSYSGRHLAEIQIALDWSEKNGQKRSYELSSLLLSPSGPRPMIGVPLYDANTLDNDIRELFYPNLRRDNLNSAVSKTGGDIALIRNLGIVGVSIKNMNQILASLTSDIQSLRSKRKTLLQSSTYQLVATQINIARKCESAASLIFNGLLSLQKAFAEIKNTFRISKLGSLRYIRITGAFYDIVNLYPKIVEWIRNSGEEYDWMLVDYFWYIRSRRIEEYSRIKSLEALRLLATLAPADRSAYANFIQRETARLAGRNHYWELLLLREQKLSKDESLFKTVFSNLTEISRLYYSVLKPIVDLSDKIYKKQLTE